MTPGLNDLIHDLFVDITTERAWRKFLATLRTLTGADDANIAFLNRNARWEDVITVRDEPPLGSGERLTWKGFFCSLSGNEREQWLKYLLALPYQTMKPDVPVAFEELLAAGGEAERAFRDKFLVPSMHLDSHTLRVREPGGADGWLAISRRHGRFDEGALEVLSTIVSPLRTAVGIRAEYEMQSRRTRLLSSAMTKLGHAWVLLDARGAVIDGDERAIELTALAGVKDSLRKALKTINASRDLPTVAVHAGDDGMIELLVVPYHDRSLGDPSPAAAIAFMHEEHESFDPTGVSEMAQLHKLTPAEARLALALSRGRSIAEAAEDLGIGVESARTYTKKIYAKTGTRGQSDLVRRIRSGVVSLA